MKTFILCHPDMPSTNRAVTYRTDHQLEFFDRSAGLIALMLLRHRLVCRFYFDKKAPPR